MKIPLIFTFLCSTTFAFQHKDQEIQLFIDLQSKVLKLSQDFNSAPFQPGSVGKNTNLLQGIKDLDLEKLTSPQLYRLALACYAMMYPGEAGDAKWDDIYDQVCWTCVRIIASRSGPINTNYLERMKALFGEDGGPSLLFKKYIAEQKNLPCKQ